MTQGRRRDRHRRDQVKRRLCHHRERHLFWNGQQISIPPTQTKNPLLQHSQFNTKNAIFVRVKINRDRYVAPTVQFRQEDLYCENGEVRNSPLI